MFCCQFLGRKLLETTSSFLGSKIFLSRTQLLAKLQGQRLSDFLLLSFFQLIKSSDCAKCLYKRENAQVPKYENGF